MANYPNAAILPMASRPAQKSLLLDLPPELRNEIYNYVLPSTIVINKDYLTATSLLRTCSTIRRETEKMLYTNTDFLIHVGNHHEHYLRWLHIMTRLGQVPKLKSITFAVGLCDQTVSRDEKHRVHEITEAEGCGELEAYELINVLGNARRTDAALGLHTRRIRFEDHRARLPRREERRLSWSERYRIWYFAMLRRRVEDEARFVQA